MRIRRTDQRPVSDVHRGWVIALPTNNGVALLTVESVTEPRDGKIQLHLAYSFGTNSVGQRVAGKSVIVKKATDMVTVVNFAPLATVESRRLYDAYALMYNRHRNLAKQLSQYEHNLTAAGGVTSGFRAERLNKLRVAEQKARKEYEKAAADYRMISRAA
jgi:hypothetical protein